MSALTVSVIIPTYNRAHLVTRAIDSALGQIVPGDEIIVVDDGSRDDTQAVLRSRYGQDLRYIQTTTAGAGAARNRGVRDARCDLVAFLDSDDEWMPNKLDLCRRVLEARPDVLFCFSNMAATMPDGTEVRNYLRFWHNDPRSWDEILGPGVPFSSIATLPIGSGDFLVHVGNIYRQMAHAIYVFTSTVVVKRRECGNALHFEEDIPTYEDWICYGRIAKRGLAAYLGVETAWQHGSDGPRLTDADALTTSVTRMKILERLWGTDPEFMGHNGEMYDRLYNEQRLRRLRSLLAQGAVADARAELRHCRHVPMLYRLLAAVPGSVVQAIVRARRRRGDSE